MVKIWLNYDYNVTLGLTSSLKWGNNRHAHETKLDLINLN